VSIRELRSDDYEDWLDLWAGYLSFYRVDISEEVTRKAFARLSERTDGMFGLVAADADGRLVGFAHGLVHRSTWTLEGYCYLEDLFVAPSARGGDTGRALIAAVALAARERHVERMYWHTQQFNGAARSLYDTVGRLTSMIVYERPV